MKLYYKNKILINGLFPLVDFEIDKYKQKTGKYDEKIVDVNSNDYIFYASINLIKSCYACKEKEGVYYEYFENDELFEYEIEDKYKGNKSEIERILLDEMVEKVSLLEKKLRLVTGIKISLPVFKTTIYDENRIFLTYVGNMQNQTPCFNISEYDGKLKATLIDRLKFHIIDDVLLKLENENIRYKRALNFYNRSFLYDDIGVGITLLISSLEALFNIDGQEVTETLAHYTSKIMFLPKSKERSIKWKVKNFYNKRSRYIHGNDVDDPITKEDEYNLRTIIREVLLIYWNLSLYYQLTNAEEIKQLIDNLSLDTLDVQVQLFIKYLRTSPIEYSELFNKIKTKLENNDTNILSDKSI